MSLLFSKKSRKWCLKAVRLRFEDEIRGWKEGRDLAAARASLPVQGPEPPASVRVLPAP